METRSGADQDLPRVDQALLAPERDPASDAPEVTESSDPEVSYRDHPPEVSSQAPKETEKLSRADNGIAGGPTQKSRTRWKLILGGIVILVVAVALGVGLGVGLSRRHGNHTNKDDDQTASSDNSSLPRAIQDDSSLATVTDSNGDQHVFFQDNNGTVRQAIYRAGQWSSPVNYIVGESARPGTPLTAFVNGPDSLYFPNTIILYWIASNNSVVVSGFAGGSWWYPINDWGNTSFRAHADTRCLSAQPSNNLTADNWSGVVLAFEKDDSTMSAHFGYYDDGAATGNGEQNGLTWLDVTNNVTKVFPDAKFSCPFTTTTVGLGGDSPQFVGLFRDANHDPSPNYKQLPVAYNAGNDTFIQYRQAIAAFEQEDLDAYNADIPRVADRDVVLASVYNTTEDGFETSGPYGMVVNGTELVMFRTEFAGPLDGPSTSFPYTRLATATPVNSTVFKLYHQINNTVLAEETFDVEVGFWDTAYITIETG